ncbi:MAG: hypothetical protein CME62_10245 [Halobacteriovoraceae bacterium]|nr:hypothetical protein [Halobacteriovoraceae bacterium]|tara:strand:- start:6761 stop:7525 length:765 start_codon:yes stop_codon:yes gene_type:complete
MKFFIFCLVLPTFLFAQGTKAKDFKFKSQSGLSMIQTTGNAEVETYNLDTETSWKKTKRIYTLKGNYTLGYAEEVNEDTGEENKVETARNWAIELKYEQIMSDWFSGFLATSMEGDEFAGIERRNNYDIGVKQYLVQTDNTTSFAEVGYRYTNELRTEDDEDGDRRFIFNKGRVYYEISHKKSEDLSVKFWVEYLPNFTRSEDYIISYEPSVSYILSEVFSLKTAYKNRYDNEPNAEDFEKTDTQLTTSIIAKF